jgi:GTPase SAR1 family protein
LENKVVFSIFIDIPEDRLDNPGWYDQGKQVITDKSKVTKLALLNNAELVTERQKQYANDIGADYILFQYDSTYKKFFNDIKNRFTEISEYDIVNFYKHRVMRDLADQYEYVCYLDFDVVPNTTDCIFQSHNVDKMMAVAESNRLAFRGQNMHPDLYNLCIRNPATKYWNTHALLMEEGYDPENDVFNTGIMAASSEVIKQLDYFKDFDNIINLMSESVFSYCVKSREIQIEYLAKEWHWLVDELVSDPSHIDPNAKLYHFINKKMEWIKDINRNKVT